MTVRTLSHRIDDSTARISARFQSRLVARRAQAGVPAEEPADAGMSTAEYAVGTVAAVGLAAVFMKLITSGPMTKFLGDLIINGIKKVTHF